MTIPYAAYLDAIGEEAERLLDAARRGPEAPIPTCPGWTMADLTGHLAHVYRHWSAQLRAADPANHAEVERLAPGSALGALESLESEATELVRTLESVDPDEPCWNWSEEDFSASWVARRMALETAIHRVDAELALGKAHPIERELAVDGIDERITVHLATDLRPRSTASTGGTLCLVCADADAAWVVEVEHGRLRYRSGRGPADVALVGTASELFCFSWNRVDLSVFDVTGDVAVADAWRTLPT